MELLSQSARFGLPWALSTFTWQCLLSGEFDRGVREFEESIAACETVVGRLQSEPAFAVVAAQQLANARSNAALLLLASGGPQDQAEAIWAADRDSGNPESMFYPAVMAERRGDREFAIEIVRGLPLGVWFEVRDILRRGFEEGGWFAEWCREALVVLERAQPPNTIPSPADIDVGEVSTFPLASESEMREGLWDAVARAVDGESDAEQMLRHMAAEDDETAWVARMELGTLLSDPGLRPASNADEGVGLLVQCLQAPFRDVVATACWNLGVMTAASPEDAQAFRSVAVALGDGTAMRTTAEQLLDSGDESDAVELFERAVQELPLGDQNSAISRAHLARISARGLPEDSAAWFRANQGAVSIQSWAEHVAFSLWAGDFNVDVAQAAIASEYFDACPAECYFEPAPFECGDCGRSSTTFLHAASGEGDGGYTAFNLIGPLVSEEIDKLGVFIPFMQEERGGLVFAGTGHQFLRIVASGAPFILGTLKSKGRLFIYDAAKCTDDEDVAVSVDVPPDEYVVVCWLRPQSDPFSGVLGSGGSTLKSIALAAVRGPLAEHVLDAVGPDQPAQRSELIDATWGDEDLAVHALMADIRPEVLTAMIQQTQDEHSDSFLLQFAERSDDGADARDAVRESGRVGSQETLELLAERGFVEPNLPWWEKSMATDRSDIWSSVVAARQDSGLLPNDLRSQPVWVRRSRGKRSDISSDELLSLAQDEDARTRRNVAANPTSPVEVLMTLIDDPEPSVASALASQPNATIEMLSRLAHRQPPPTGSLASNPNTPIGLLHELVPHMSRGARTTLAGRSDLTDQLAEQLSTDIRSVRRALASNPRCYGPVLEALAQDSNSWVRSEVASNPSTPENALAQLSLDSEQHVRENVLGNPAAPEAVRAQASLLGATRPAPETSATQAAAKGVPSAAPQKFCTACGSPLDPSHRFCGQCGTQIAGSATSPPPALDWNSLQSQWEIRGNFNVEGGSASFGNRIFEACDCENTSDEPCDCGRMAGNYVAVTSGSGDGVYPVFRLRNEFGDVTGVIAMFEQDWAVGTENSSRNPAALATSALPIYAGSVVVEDLVYASEAGAGWDADYALVDVELPPGTYEAIAWQAEMDILREQGLQPYVRQIAFGLYSPEMIRALESVSPPDRRVESRIAMSSESRAFDQVLAHAAPRWADACMYNAREDSDRGETDRAESWILQAALYGHEPARSLLPPGFLDSQAPLDVARRTRLLAMRGQRSRSH